MSTMTRLMVLGMVAGSAPAMAQTDAANFPARTIRIIVPQSPGASTDITARLVAQRLNETFKQPVVVDNRPGAGSTSGTEMVARAAPDGYTLLVVASSFTVNPSLYKKISYDIVRDFAPVTQLSRFPNLLAAHPSLPVKTLADVIKLAKARPGQLNYASAGTGTGTHMSAELLRQMTGIDIVQVPFKGGGPAMVAVIGGQTEMIVGTTVGLMQHVRGGKLRAIAVTSPKRSAVVPDIPAMAETVPGYEHQPWNGLLAPAKTPAGVIARLNTEAARAMHSPEVKKVFASDAAEAVGNSPEEFAAIIKSEAAKWAKVIQVGGIKIE